MKIQLLRKRPAEDRVLGTMYIDGYEVYDTLEPSNCIPAGTYQVKMTYSPAFRKYLPLIMGVPGRDGIRIHSGNFPTDTAGCVLVGLREQNYLTCSRECMDSLLTLFKAHKDETHTIEVVDAADLAGSAVSAGDAQLVQERQDDNAGYPQRQLQYPPALRA